LSDALPRNDLRVIFDSRRPRVHRLAHPKISIA